MRKIGDTWFLQSGVASFLHEVKKGRKKQREITKVYEKQPYPLNKVYTIRYDR